MGSSGKGGGGAPPPSAEYQQYLSTWQSQNPSMDMNGLLGGSKASFEGSKASFGGSKPETRTVPASVQGEYSGTPRLSETDYYVSKQNKQQQQLQQQMTQQQEQYNSQLIQMQQQQNTLLTQQKAEIEEAQKAAYLKNQQSIRDSMFAERTSAEESAIDYVNAQISKERSNAALFGMSYNMTDEDKAARTADYFGSIWNEGNEVKLKGLMEEVGKPDSFTDFVLERGSGATLPKNEASSAAKSEIVNATKGTDSKKRPGVLNSLLTSGDAGSGTLLGS